MEIFRWQWRLGNRAIVAAAIDTKRNVETVMRGQRVLSEAPRGSRPAGHTVLVEGDHGDHEEGESERPPVEVVVTFDPRTPICVLRVDGQEIAPSQWPVRERTKTVPPVTRPWGKVVLFAVVLAVLIAAALFVAERRKSVASRPAAQLGGTHRSMNGLFIAHFPEDLEARLAVLPSGVSGVVIEDKAKSMTILIAAFAPDPSIANDPWAIQKQLRDEALANVPKGAARFTEDARREESCLGQRGAAVSGKLADGQDVRGRVWSCAFVHGPSGYLVLYAVPEGSAATDGRKARGVVDATELTRLADLGGGGDLSR